MHEPGLGEPRHRIDRILVLDLADKLIDGAGGLNTRPDRMNCRLADE
jgi:hypothetical protein